MNARLQLAASLPGLSEVSLLPVAHLPDRPSEKLRREQSQSRPPFAALRTTGDREPAHAHRPFSLTALHIVGALMYVSLWADLPSLGISCDFI